MKWIDVNDDLPPKGVRVLAHVQMRDIGPFHITDAYFDPGMGWFTWGFDAGICKVYHWHPLNEMPKMPDIEEESIQHSLEAFRAACAKLDDSQ